MKSVLVIGGGSIGERHVRCFASTGRADVWLCEIDEAVRRSVTERYGLSRSFAALADALTVKPEVAVVATPAHLHLEQAHQLIESGSSVLVEKPLSTDVDGATAFVRFAESCGSVCGVAYVMRHHPAIVRLRRYINERRLGEVREIVYRGGQDFPRLRPAYRTIYYRERSTGGGAVQDALTHTINWIEWLVGPTTSVAADVDRLVLEGVEVEDTVHVVARNGGVMANYALNQHQAPNESTVDVHCTEGSFRMETHRSRLRLMERGADVWTDEAFDAGDRDTGFVAQANAFLDAVAGRHTVSCTLPEALATLDTCLAILRAADGGRWEMCNVAR